MVNKFYKALISYKENYNVSFIISSKNIEVGKGFYARIKEKICNLLNNIFLVDGSVLISNIVEFDETKNAGEYFKCKHVLDLLYDYSDDVCFFEKDLKKLYSPGNDDLKIKIIKLLSYKNSYYILKEHYYLPCYSNFLSEIFSCTTKEMFTIEIENLLNHAFNEIVLKSIEHQYYDHDDYDYRHNCVELLENPFHCLKKWFH